MVGLDVTFDNDDDSGTRSEQLLRHVEEHCIRLVFGSSVSLNLSAMMVIDTDGIVEIGRQLEFCD